MQKDVHFYLTYTLAVKAGVDRETAKLIAWANQKTDEVVSADLHGIQTSSDVVGNWVDRQIQATVLVPFHFVPGDDKKNPWTCTANSRNIQRLILAAENNPIRLGIALHALQDSYSHQGFSGWQEKLNSCYPWYNPASIIPNVGHAELMCMPDDSGKSWIDPRTNTIVDNRERAYHLAIATTKVFSNKTCWGEEIPSVFKDKKYDSRKQRLRNMVNDPAISYTRFDKEEGDLPWFKEAAREHLSLATSLFPNQR